MFGSADVHDGMDVQVNRDGAGGLCSNFRATLAFQQIKVQTQVSKVMTACIKPFQKDFWPLCLSPESFYKNSLAFE